MIGICRVRNFFQTGLTCVSERFENGRALGGSASRPRYLPVLTNPYNSAVALVAWGRSEFQGQVPILVLNTHKKILKSVVG